MADSNQVAIKMDTNKISKLFSDVSNPQPEVDLTRQKFVERIPLNFNMPVSDTEGVLVAETKIEWPDLVKFKTELELIWQILVLRLLITYLCHFDDTKEITDIDWPDLVVFGNNLVTLSSSQTFIFSFQELDLDFGGKSKTDRMEGDTLS